MRGPHWLIEGYIEATLIRPWEIARWLGIRDFGNSKFDTGFEGVHELDA